MLLQQSLDEIADGTTSEQIAYLLVERARLMDELEAVESRATIETPEGPLTGAQLLELLEQERVEFEEELGQQRESLRGAKETMRRGHEEEITTMMTENEKLQDMLDEAKQQVRGWFNSYQGSFVLFQFFFSITRLSFIAHTCGKLIFIWYENKCKNQGRGNL